MCLCVYEVALIWPARCFECRIKPPAVSEESLPLGEVNSNVPPFAQSLSPVAALRPTKCKLGYKLLCARALLWIRSACIRKLVPGIKRRWSHSCRWIKLCSLASNQHGDPFQSFLLLGTALSEPWCWWIQSESATSWCHVHLVFLLCTESN